MKPQLIRCLQAGLAVITGMLPIMAQADFLGILPPDKHIDFRVNALLKGKPDMDPARARALVVPGEKKLADLKKSLAPAPLFHDSKIGTWFQGRIIKIIPARPGGDYRDPASHETYLFMAYGKNGSPVSRKPVLISRYYIRGHLYHEFDTLLDIRRLVSNRHELLGLAIDDPVYRKSLYRHFDPDGKLGLYTSGGKTISGKVVPNSLDSLVENGYPLLPKMIFKAPPAMINAMRSNWQRNFWHSFMQKIVYGVARSKRYPAAFDKTFRKQAIATGGLLCTLARVQPDLAPAAIRYKAKNLYKLGRDSIIALVYLMQPLPPERSGRPNRYLGANYHNPALPLGFVDIAEASAEVVANEPGLRLFIGKISESQVEGPSARLARVLVQLAMNSYRRGKHNKPIPRLQHAAGLALDNIFKHDPDVDEDDRDSYRRALYGFLTSEIRRERQYACQRLAKYGWGDPEYFAKTVDYLFYLARGRLKATKGYSRMTLPELKQAAADHILCLRTIRKTLRKRHGKIAQEIDKRIARSRKRASGKYPNKLDVKFMRIWNSK
jgi:hypothetical protein